MAPLQRKGVGSTALVAERQGAAAPEGAARFPPASSFTGTPTSIGCFPPPVQPHGACWGQGGSPMSPPWMHPQALDPTTWDNDPTPQGGFTNSINSQPLMSQNYHFVGGPSHFGPFKPPRPLDASPSQEDTTTPRSTSENNKYINVDSGDEVVRTEKRILWTQEENVRLMSAWLLNSMDSSIGADRKNEQYWGDVVETYNKTTPGNRKRNQKQAKDRWHKINKWTDLFHSVWVKARRIFTSGYNDQMWIEKAYHFYVEDNKLLSLGPFVLMDVWYTVRNEAKWITYNLGLNQARKRKGSDKEVAGEDIEHVDAEENA